MSLSALAAAALLQAVDPVPATAGPAPEPATVVEGVTVTAPALDVVDAFIAELALPGRHGRFQGQLARWSAPLCPIAIGGAPKANAYLVARVVEVARSVGVRTARGKCRPNVVVVLTEDADGFIDLFSERYRRRFFSTGSRSELAAFRSPPRPVRWWHVTRETCAEAAPTSPAELLIGSSQSTETACPLRPTRLGASTQTDITRSLVVVDTKRLQALHSRSTSAYVAFAALAHLPQQPELSGGSSILNAFAKRDAGERPPRDLTDWDRAFLKGLYGIRSDERFPMQRTALRQRMGSELVAEPKALAPP